MWNMPLWDHHMPLVQWGAVISASLAAAVFDIRSQRIPNRLTFAVLVTGLIWASWVGGLVGMMEAICGCLVLAAPFLFLFVLAGGGAGDAKLMGALGAWLGMVNGLVALVSVVMVGALWGLGFALAKKRFAVVLNRGTGIVLRLMLLTPGYGGWMAARTGPKKEEKEESGSLVMPYGVSIFGGICVAAAGVLLWRCL